MVRILKGFGCSLRGYDIYENPQAKDIELSYVPLNRLLSECDIISLHCPLNASTHYLIDKAEFELIKNGAYLINTAKGSVVNSKAMIKY